MDHGWDLPWSRIESRSNYGVVDVFEGQPLRDGDLLMVKWPNGTEELVRVITRTSRAGSGVHAGGGWDTASSVAGARAEANGVEVWAPLVGLLARRPGG